MNFERAKSIILIILVGTSVFLTWNIWTYEPDYEKIDESDLIKIKSDEQIVSDIIKPVRVLFHRNGQHFETVDPVKIGKMEKELSKWDYRDVKQVPLKMIPKDFESYIHEDRSIEITYSDDVPMSLYNSVLDIEDENISSFFFDRIVIKQKDIGGDRSAVYFISYKQRRVYQAMVPTGNLRAFSEQFYNKEYPIYTALTLGAHKKIYIPEKPTKVNRYQYYIDNLDIDNLKGALFNNPKYVRQEIVSRGEEYSDGTRLLSVNKEDYVLSYINPAQKIKVFGNSGELLEKSIDFINDHAGWEGSNYRFDYLSENEQRVVFRLFIDGYPAFNESGMTEIEQVWGKEDIYSYRRPYFKLASVLPSDGPVATLPTGKEVVDQLKANENVDFESVQDITIGYKLTKSLDSKLVTLVTLEPTWYYQTGEKWVIVPFEDAGGDNDGLE